MPRSQPVDKKNALRLWSGQNYAEIRSQGVPKEVAYSIPGLVPHVIRVDQDFSGRYDDILVPYIEQMALIPQLKALAKITNDEGKIVLVPIQMAKMLGLKRESISDEEAWEIIHWLKRNAPQEYAEKIEEAKKKMRTEEMVLPVALGEAYSMNWIRTDPDRHAMYTQGKTKKRNQIYSSWVGRFQLMQGDLNNAPFIRFEGPPGSGKSSSMTTVSQEAAWRFNYWMRSNLPYEPYSIYSKPINAMQIGRFTDLLIDEPEGTSIFHAAEQGNWVILDIDEHGLGMEGYSQSVISSLYKELFTLRRHIRLIIKSTGVGHLPPDMEEFVTLKITCKAEETSRRERYEIKKKYSWILHERTDDPRFHEDTVIESIPKPDQELHWHNDLQMADGLIMDMSFKQMTERVHMNQPYKTLIPELSEFAKMQRAIASAMDPMEVMKAIAAGKSLERAEIEENNGGESVVAKKGLKYECLDCHNVWLYTGHSKPRCTNRKCMSFDVQRTTKPLTEKIRNANR